MNDNKKEPLPTKIKVLNQSIAYIKLTQDKYAVIDKKDFKWLNQWKWCFEDKRHTGYGYAVRRQWEPLKKRYKHILMHRLIMESPKGMQIDHQNGNGLDNRRENLRIVTNQQNRQNQFHYRKLNKTSSYKGVYWNKNRNKWTTFIGINGIRTYLGQFDNERYAAMAYDIWAKDLFGEYAKLNFERII